MMKNLFLIGMLASAMTFSLAACSDDDDPKPVDPVDPVTPVTPTDPNEGKDAADYVYTSSIADAWGNYMRNVSLLLRTDATTLYDDWTDSYNGDDSYATIFKAHDGREDFNSALNCIEQMIDGCTDIASEVGSSKIGEPYDLYVSGDTEGALYAVESWYSWHSREDYRNNIYSIRNAYFGSLDGTVNVNSMSAVVKSVDPELDAEVTAAINAAAEAIMAIPQPFRNNINSTQAAAAMDACGDLETILDEELRPFFTNTAAINTNAVLDPVVQQYVDGVVIPTYTELKAKNSALHDAVSAFQANPSNAGFVACCNAWLDARTPWESSEAFLFGPVADKGLDPNMDSWPLDQVAIVNILKSQDWAAMEWEGDYDEDDEAIASKQEVRGFHTLEFLIFKDDQPRTINN